MEINNKFVEKYMFEIARDQLIDEYKRQGYSEVKKQIKEGLTPDLILSKGSETIFVEIKYGKLPEAKKQAIAQLSEYVRQIPGAKFHVAIVTPPKDKILSISNLNDLLFEILNNDLPSELDELSSHTRIEDIIDVDIDEISVEQKKIYVTGDGVVEVELQWGSDGDVRDGDGVETNTSFPFDFSLYLEYDERKGFVVSEVEGIEVDTSSYYE